MTGTERVILDAAVSGSVIRGTLTAPTGVRREFHGGLELNTALEAILQTGADDRRGAVDRRLSDRTLSDGQAVEVSCGPVEVLGHHQDAGRAARVSGTVSSRF